MPSLKNRRRQKLEVIADEQYQREKALAEKTRTCIALKRRCVRQQSSYITWSDSGSLKENDVFICSFARHLLHSASVEHKRGNSEESSSGLGKGTEELVFEFMSWNLNWISLTLRWNGMTGKGTYFMLLSSALCWAFIISWKHNMKGALKKQNNYIVNKNENDSFLSLIYTGWPIKTKCFCWSNGENLVINWNTVCKTKITCKIIHYNSLQSRTDLFSLTELYTDYKYVIWYNCIIHQCFDMPFSNVTTCISSRIQRSQSFTLNIPTRVFLDIKDIKHRWFFLGNISYGTFLHDLILHP